MCIVTSLLPTFLHHISNMHTWLLCMYILMICQVVTYVFPLHRNKTSSFAIPIGVTNNVIPNIYEEAPAHATVTTQAPTAKEATVYTNYKCEYL